MLLLQIIWRQLLCCLTRLSPDLLMRAIILVFCAVLGAGIFTFGALAKTRLANTKTPIQNADKAFTKKIITKKSLEKSLIVQVNHQTYRFELADNEEKAQQGLMYRTALAPSTGMAFPFDPPELAVFWMKNTLIPLDMVFVRNQRVVRILENVQPCPKAQSDHCPLYSSIVPVDWVLELPAGTAKKDRLERNQRLKFKK